VIPVLVDGARPPLQRELPAELHELANLPFIEMETPTSDTGQLVSIIQQVFNKRVFVSYRRKLSEHLARSVNNDLIKYRFDTFVDLENLDSGDFEPVILSQIEAREHFIVLLQPGSLDQIGEDGDWLRREIAHALAHRRNVVPVTADGFEFRRDLVLPPDVAKLPDKNGVVIPPVYFDAAMEKLRTRFLKMPSNP
jgi:TIR domain